MNARHYNVLFLCTGNSARSILAEALLGSIGKKRFEAYSAGSHPQGSVQPIAADLAVQLGYPVERLRSKSWDEFAEPAAPAIDIVITVCDSAASETCPIWPGHPVTAHWGVADPARVEGDDAARRRAYIEAMTVLRRRVELLVALPIDTLDRLSMQRELRAIGASDA